MLTQNRKMKSNKSIAAINHFIDMLRNFFKSDHVRISGAGQYVLSHKDLAAAISKKIMENKGVPDGEATIEIPNGDYVVRVSVSAAEKENPQTADE